MKRIIKIATRQSPLALWQTQFVKESLLKIDPDLEISFIGLTTAGDRETTQALTDLGGKSLFVKELQKTVLDNDADMAVHSIKDMSVQSYPGLSLAAICQREDPRDAFISKHYDTLNDLPINAVIGTASPRRIALLNAQRPDLKKKTIRGNIGTRLNKCDQGEYHAIILAVAGLKRLNLNHRIKDYFDPEIFIPAIAQAAIGVECRENDEHCCSLLKAINHENSESCVLAERAVNQVLGGDCHTPIAAHAIIESNQLTIRGMVGSINNSTILRCELSGPTKEAIKIGQSLGQALLDKGADVLLNNKS